MELAVVSFRLGWEDGVSVEAAKWVRALGRLGHRVRTVAGGGVADRMVAGLDSVDEPTPRPSEVIDALAGADLVIALNICSLPLKPASSGAVWHACRGRRAVFVHYDLPWQRARFAHVEGWPATEPGWQHVVLNELSRAQLAGRGVDATVVLPGFDPPPAATRGPELRRALHIRDGEHLLLQPTRAIARKGLPDAVRLAGTLGAHLWVTGPAEEGYEAELAAVLAAASGPVHHRWPPGDWTMDDAYAACDMVSFPSHWEGFGNPVVESALARRALVVRRYPVARELEAFGFRWFDVDDPAAVERAARHLRSPDAALLDHNAQVARTHFSMDAFSARIAAVLDRAANA